MNFEKRLLQVKIFGETYQLSFPTVKQVQELTKSQKEEADGDNVASTIKFISKLGLPEDVAWELEIDQLQELATLLMGSKKK